MQVTSSFSVAYVNSKDDACWSVFHSFCYVTAHSSAETLKNG